MMIPRCQESRIEWIGNIPARWHVLPLFTICREQKRKNVGNRETNVLSLSYGRIVRRDVSANFGLLPESFETYHLVNAGDVVLRLTDLQNDQTSLRVGLATERGIITSAYVTLRPSDQFDSTYLFYLLHAYDVCKVFYGYGGGIRQAMRFDDLKRLPLIVPAQREQQAIASFLDRKTAAIDALVAKKKRLIELLQEKRHALVTQTVTKGLDPSVSMKDSGHAWLASIPSTWSLLRLKQLSHRISGRLVYQPAQYFVESGVPFIMGNNVTERGVVFDNVKFIPSEINERFAHHALRHGDVVTVRVGAPGVTAVVPPEAVGLNCGSLMIIRGNAAFDSRWLAAVMNSQIIRSQIDLVQYGAAQEQINITDAVNFLLPTPPRAEQAAMATFLERATRQIDASADKILEQIERLREYRQALISAAVTGTIDVLKEPS